MQTPPPSNQPDLNQVLTPAAPPPPPPPTVKPVLVTEQQLEGELGNLVGSAGQPPRRGRRILLWLSIIVVVVAALAWAAQYFGWLGGSANNGNTDLNSASPLESNTSSALDSAPPTNSAAPDLTTTTGRDSTRRERLTLFVSAAEAAAKKQVNLPITTTAVKLNDLANPTVKEVRQLLLDQGLTDAQIDEYLLDPSPDYYFGYSYDGQLLTLTAVMESGGTDCSVVKTAGGSICVLTKTVDL